MQVERRTGKVRQPKTDVLPQCLLGAGGLTGMCYLAPTVWNSLRDHLQDPTVDQQFRRDLKTYPSPDIRSVSALDAFNVIALYKSTFTYLLTY